MENQQPQLTDKELKILKKVQRPFWKKKRFIIPAIILLIIIIANLGGGDDGSQPTGGSVAETNETKKDAAPVSKEGVSSDVKIAVLGVQDASTVGNEYTKENAQGVFKIVEISITNNQQDAITIDSNSFKLVDSKGREFTYSSDAQITFDIATGNESLFLKSLNPGLTLTAKMVFDIPADATGLYMVAQGGMTGEKIKLKIN